MDNHLLIHNILFLLGGWISIGTAFFVFLSARKHHTITSITFALSSLAVAVFQISQLLGANADNPVTSKYILMFNLVDLFIGMFTAHWFIGFIGKAWQKRYALATIYGSGLGIFIFFLIFPNLFLVDSVPKLYLPFYYEPGRLYIVMVIWFTIVTIYQFYQFIQAYRKEKDLLQRKRYRYVLGSMSYAYIFGVTAFLLVFDIPFDPAFAALCGLYPILLLYTILRYEIFDIRILAKRTFTYVSIILIIGTAITSLSLLGNYFSGIEPDFPKWMTPAILSILVGSGVIYVWHKGREADIARYEFITIVTHKFRTPLTRIKWSAEDISDEIPTDKREMLDIILESERELIALTDVLVGLSEVDGSRFEYHPTKLSLAGFIDSLIVEYLPRAERRDIVLSHTIPAGLFIVADDAKTRFVFQILLDNALNYTVGGGSVSINAYKSSNSRYAVIEVTDTGIGMSRETILHAFNQFYRGHNARHEDTEGMGIGLFMAKNIIEKQGGTMWVASEGEGKGSTVFIKIPIRT